MKTILRLLAALFLLVCTGCCWGRRPEGVVSLRSTAQDTPGMITLADGRASMPYKWHDIFTCRHAGLSEQFDIALRIEHDVNSAPQEEYDPEDSLAVELCVTEKESGRRLDLIHVRPASLGMSFWRDRDCRGDATSYSTGFNADREPVDNYLGTVVVADLNFDGRDDIAAVADSGVSSGPYYAFFIQDADGRFVRDDFLGGTMKYFPTGIDPSRRRLTTLSPANAYEMSKTVFELSRDTGKWQMVVCEIAERRGAGAK